MREDIKNRINDLADCFTGEGVPNLAYIEQGILELNNIVNQAKNNEVLDLVSSSLRIEDFHIGFEYLQYEMDSERYLNKGMIWKKKKYGFDSHRLHKIKELIDNGEIARCNES